MNSESKITSETSEMGQNAPMVFSGLIRVVFVVETSGGDSSFSIRGGGG